MILDNLFALLLGVAGTLLVSGITRRDSYKQGAYTVRAAAVQRLLAKARPLKDEILFEKRSALDMYPKTPVGGFLKPMDAIEDAKIELRNQAFHEDVWIGEKGVAAVREFLRVLDAEHIGGLDTAEEVEDLLDGAFSKLREQLRKDLGFKAK